MPRRLRIDEETLRERVRLLHVEQDQPTEDVAVALRDAGYQVRYGNTMMR